RESMPWRLELWRHVAHRHRQHELAAQFPAMRVEILFAVDDGNHCFARDWSVGSGRPGFGIRDERIGARRKRERHESLVLPAASGIPTKSAMMVESAIVRWVVMNAPVPPALNFTRYAGADVESAWRPSGIQTLP